jgi:intein-encoded DNA endonuclease-like protein
MKTLNFILLLFVFSILISCSEDKNDLEYNLPYFQFKNEDTPNLLNLPELNARLTFVNQKNEELYFDAVKSESGRQLHSTGSWASSYSIKYFYFNEQRIHLRTTLFDVKEFERDIEITTSRRPKEFNDGRNGKP